MYANIRYKVHCPNEHNCHNEGVYLEQIQCGEIRDEETGEIIDVDWDLQPCQCQFCCENKSSIYNGGTIGMFSLEGLIDTIGPKHLQPFKLDFQGQIRHTFNDLPSMHGKRIAIFRQVKAESKIHKKELLYEFYSEGRCLGRCIFSKDGTKHDINFESFHYIYIEAFEPNKNTEYRVNLSLDF